MNLLERITKRIRVHFERDHDILGTTIRLPAGHMLDWIRLHHRRYDMPLGDVSDCVVRKYPNACMIDIGANVGDSAAFMVQGSKSVSLLCVEGNATYLPYLRQNLPAISPKAEIEAAYVGATDGVVHGQMVASNGTAKLTDGGGTVETKSLATVLNEHPTFAATKLLKIDTDGHDSKIILSSLDILKRMRPVIFLEYYPLGPSSVAAECQEMLHALAEIGYSNFHVFDNFGDHMLRVSSSQTEQLRSLTAYVRATQRGIRPALGYYDICAFHSEDSDLSDKLLGRYIWDS